MNQVATRSSPFCSGQEMGDRDWVFPDEKTKKLQKRLLQELRWIDRSYSSISPIAGSEATFLWMMLNFFKKRKEFRCNGKPSGVQIGYHYTSERAACSIRNEGLTTTRAVRGYYGRGIYVGNNPHAFKAYGDVGLIVLILVGTQKKMYSPIEETTDAYIASADSFHGNKAHKANSFSGASRYFEETVLRDDKQILPLFKFRRDLTNNSDLLERIHASIQMMVDRLFPDGSWPAPLTPVRPHFSDLCFEHRLAQAMSTNTVPNRFTAVFAALTTPAPQQTQPQCFRMGSEICDPSALKQEQNNIQICASVISPSQLKNKEDCAICLSPLCQGMIVATNKCNHTFHGDCLKQALSVSKNCPMCRVLLMAEPAGNCPPGNMEIKLYYNRHCGGLEEFPSIQIKYTIPGGVQTQGHQNPGQRFPGTVRKAFLPGNEDGYDLLKRLRYAFRRGLTFTVGTSLTSSRSNVVVWASVHHKTTRDLGPHGWPDPCYFANVNEELDAMNVPKASEL